MPKEAPVDILETYRAAAAAEPQSAAARSNLGWGYYGRRQFAEALDEFQAAVELDANLVDAHYGLALAHKGAGAKGKAVSSFEDVVRLAQQLPDQVRGRMLVRLSHGHINEINTGEWNIDAEMRHHEP